MVYNCDAVGQQNQKEKYTKVSVKNEQILIENLIVGLKNWRRSCLLALFHWVSTDVIFTHQHKTPAGALVSYRDTKIARIFSLLSVGRGAADPNIEFNNGTCPDRDPAQLKRIWNRKKKTKKKIHKHL